MYLFQLPCLHLETTFLRLWQYLFISGYRKNNIVVSSKDHYSWFSFTGGIKCTLVLHKWSRSAINENTAMFSTSHAVCHSQAFFPVFPTNKLSKPQIFFPGDLIFWLRTGPTTLRLLKTWEGYFCEESVHIFHEKELKFNIFQLMLLTIFNEVQSVKSFRTTGKGSSQKFQPELQTMALNPRIHVGVCMLSVSSTRFTSSKLKILLLYSDSYTPLASTPIFSPPGVASSLLTVRGFGPFSQLLCCIFTDQVRKQSRVRHVLPSYLPARVQISPWF